MRKSLYHYLKPILLFALSFLLFTACYGQVIQKVDNSKEQSPDSTCRIAVHQLGETCVPLQPQRIIATDPIALEVLLGLGLKPLATAEQNIAGNRGRHLAGKMENTQTLGKTSQINIEKMVQLHPDLIVGFWLNSSLYRVFSQIAPTVKLDYKYAKGAWKESFREAASLLDRASHAESEIAKYQQRVKTLQQTLAHKLEKLEVSVSRFYAGGQDPPQFDTIYSFSGGVLQEVGLAAPPQQLPFATDPDVGYVPISVERIDLLDANVLFVMLDPGSERNFSQYQKSPLWQKLTVVQENKVYTVDSDYWYSGSILAANAILDDLTKYLVQKQKI